MNQSQAKNRLTFDFSIMGMKHIVAGLGIAHRIVAPMGGLTPDNDSFRRFVIAEKAGRRV
jgi:hypothetical protein